MNDTTLIDDLARQGYAVCDGFIPDSLSAALLNDACNAWQAGQFRQAGVGRADHRVLRPELRSDLVQWLDPATCTPAQASYLQTLDQLRLTLNRELQLGLVRFEGHLAVYPPGACYGKHLDRFRDLGTRTLSCVLYLSPDWQPENDGCLRLYLDGDHDHPYLDILPRAGRLVCLLSDRFYHEVLPATRERYSLTGWFCRRDPDGRVI